MKHTTSLKELRRSRKAKHMAKNFHEAYEHEIPDLPPARSTGFVFAAVALIVAAVLFYANDYSPSNGALIALGISLGFATIAQFATSLLEPLNVLWFKFSMLLFKIVNPLVMFILFALVITPAGLLMRLKADPLSAKRDKTAKTYWSEKPEEASTRSMKNQF